MRPGWLVVALLVTASVAACSSSGDAGASGAAVRIVAAENFWGDIAKQVGGGHVSVRSIIIDPTADPHLYESDPRDAAAVGKADLVVKNGLGYDDFMDRLLHVTSSSHRQVVTAADAIGITASGANPHIWYDVPRVHLVAAAIEQQLVALDPPDAGDYQHNLSTFSASLQPILATLGSIKRRHPGAPVSYTEPVPAYLLSAAGLTVKTPSGFAKAIEDGTDPSPADRSAMTALFTQQSVRALLYNSQAASSVTKHVQEVARQSLVPAVAVTETLPSGERSYQSWQQDQAMALLRALGG